MRLFSALFCFLVLFLSCSRAKSNKFNLMAFRQKVIPGAAPDPSSPAVSMYRYYLFLLPQNNSSQIRVVQICVDQMIYGAVLERLQEPYITEPIYGPEGYRRDTLLPKDKLPAFLIHLKKPETAAGINQAVCEKNQLVLELNIGKVIINHWTDLPDQIMP